MSQQDRDSTFKSTVFESLKKSLKIFLFTPLQKS